MATDQDLDFSASSAPDSWFEAAAQAPKGDRRPLRQPGMAVLPDGRTADLMTACLAATTVSGLFGVGWYLVDISNVLRSPWPAVLLGVLVALAIRFGGGRYERETRAALAALFYLVGLSTVVLLQARHAYVDIYGSASSLSVFEQELLHTRLADPWNLTAWALGLLTTIKLSLMLGVKH